MSPTSARCCHCSALAAAALYACVSVVRAQPLAEFSINRPLQVCTASIQNFGARCNGAPAAEFEQEEEPTGVVPKGGWCAGKESFCGYDIDVWREVADRMELEEGRDYERVCLGETGFSYMIESLAGENSTYVACDIGVSSITASTEREARGITFSRATFRSSLAVLVHAPLQERGIWAFFDPLHYYVWVALVVTIIIVPFFVFFFEAVFAKWTAYMKGEKLAIASGLVQCLWHSVSHTLSIDVFHVRSLPARIVTAAYAFLILILANTYTANLAAFLTVNQLDQTISSVADLRGKAVATVAPYLNRLFTNHHLVATAANGWDYDTMVAKLREGQYAAVISDDTQLIDRAASDDSCSLHLLKETIEPFDLAFAFSRNFPSATFRAAVSSTLLDMQEDGTLTDFKQDHEPPERKCSAEATEFSETNQVSITSLWGLWIILAAAIFLAGGAGAIEYLRKKRQQHEDAAKMRERAAAFRTMLPKAASLSRVTSAFWQTVEKSKRQASMTSAGPPSSIATAADDASVAAAPQATGALWARAAAATRDVPAAVPQHAAGECSAAAAQCGNSFGHGPASRFTATPSGRPSFVPLMQSSSMHSSEILDVFTCPPSVQPLSQGGGAAAVARARGSRNGSFNSRPPVSRQASHGSADRGSLGARSMGGRSDTLDAAADTHVADAYAARMASQGALDTAILRGLPLVCAQHAAAAGAAATASTAGTFGLSGDLDTDLEELTVIVQAVAHRVGVLRRTRQQERQQSQHQ